MTGRIHIGNCGWGYLIEEHFANLLTKPYESKLQAYAQLFESVEINSTYYGIPRLATAEKWRTEASQIDSKFEFTVKAYRGITHTNRFGKRAIPYYDKLKEIASAVRARIMLFQSPANFAPSGPAIEKMRAFFTGVERSNLLFAWEPRGTWYNDPKQIISVCEELQLIHCVDPFRNEPLVFGKEKIAYFRIHGFGQKSMYHYNFSKEELSWLLSVVRDLAKDLKDVYVMFNNQYCYENGRTFIEMLKAK